MLFPMLLIGTMTSCAVWEHLMRKEAVQEAVAPTASGPKTILLVNTHDTKRAGGVYAFMVDRTTAKADSVYFEPQGQASVMAYDRRKGTLYVSSGSSSGTLVNSYRLDKRTGKLTKVLEREIPQSKVSSSRDIALTESSVALIDRDNSVLHLIKRSSEGMMGKPDWHVNLSTGEGGRPHSLTFTNDGRHLFVTDTVHDRCLHFSIRRTNPPIRIGQNIALPEGIDPHQIVFDRRDKYVYILCADASKILTFGHDNGRLRLLEDTQIEGAATKGLHMASDPDGGRLLVSVGGGSPSVSTFKIDRETGLLTQERTTSLPHDVHHFAFSPDAKEIALVCGSAGCVLIYKYQPSTGVLTSTPLRLTVPRPERVVWTEGR